MVERKGRNKMEIVFNVLMIIFIIILIIFFVVVMTLAIWSLIKISKEMWNGDK